MASLTKSRSNDIVILRVWSGVRDGGRVWPWVWLRVHTNLMIVSTWCKSYETPKLLFNKYLSGEKNRNIFRWWSTVPGWGGGGVLGSSFAGYVRLASQNPYPIIVYFWYILWPIIDPILVTLGYCSLFLVYFVANYKPHLSHFWANDFLISKSRKSATPF